MCLLAAGLPNEFMRKLKCIQLDPDTVIWVEAEDDVDASEASPVPVAEVAVAGSPYESSMPNNGNGSTGVTQRQAKGLRDAFGMSAPAPLAPTSAKAVSQGLDQTIRSYTQYALRAFRDAALSEVRKVTLEFGVNLSGMSGIPYIATGTVGCNIKVTVECEFPKPEASKPSLEPTV